MNPYEPPTEQALPDRVHPLIGIPVSFGGFSAFVVGLVWVVDHYHRWYYELPFRWWM